MKENLIIGLLCDKNSNKGITTPLVRSAIDDFDHHVLEINKDEIGININFLLNELKTFPLRKTLGENLRQLTFRTPPLIPQNRNQNIHDSKKIFPPPIPARPVPLKESHGNASNEFLNYLFSNSNNYINISKIKNYAYTKLNNCNGMILPGGIDIEKYFYQVETEPLDNLLSSDPIRTILELFIINRCVTLGLPLLGICRGCQIINVYFGGTLKNVENENQEDHKKFAIIQKENSRHSIFQNKNHMNAVSMHNQCIDLIGNNLTPTSLSIRNDNNKVVKSIESKTGSLILGTQFHPEFYNDYGSNERIHQRNKYIFEYYFKTCQSYLYKMEINKSIKNRKLS